MTVEYIKWQDKESLVLCASTVIGLLTTCWVGWVIFGARDTPVVQSSSIHLMLVILGEYSIIRETM